MKYTSLFFFAALALMLVYCKPGKKTMATEPAPATTAPAKSEGEIQMEIVERRWPGTAATEVKEGQEIYTTKCTKCHQAYNIPRFSETKWLHEIDDMSPKAKLTPEEKLKLTKYILSYRETKEKVNAK